MAENKKSFILYADLIHTVKKMKSEDAGELFLHILQYVNDENPITDNIIVDLTFEPIKQQLKRDLTKYQKIKEKRSKAGKKSAKLRALKKLTSVEQETTNSTSVKSAQQTSTNPTVNDNVNDNDNVNVILLKKETKSIFNFKNELLKLDISENVVNDWLMVRKKKKAVNTEIAFKKIKKEIEESKLNPNDAITICVENSWAGFKSKWVLQKKEIKTKTFTVNRGG